MSWCFHRDYLSPNDWLSIYFCYDKKLFCQVLMHSKILATGCLNFWGSTLCQVRTVDGWNWKINNLKKNLKNSKKKKNSKGTWKDPGNRLFALLGGQSCLRCGYLDMSDIPPICWLVCCLMLENGWNRKTDWNLKNDSETPQSSKACHTWFNFSSAHMLLFIFTIKCLFCWFLADALKWA